MSGYREQSVEFLTYYTPLLSTLRINLSVDTGNRTEMLEADIRMDSCETTHRMSLISSKIKSLKIFYIEKVKTKNDYFDCRLLLALLQ